MFAPLNIPVLLSIPAPDPAIEGFQIPIGSFAFTVHTYALVILLGGIIAALMTGRRLTRRGAEPWIAIDIAVPAAILGIFIGARGYHVLTHFNDYFGPGIEWWKPFAIWEGGLAIFGGLLFGALGAWLGCRWTGVRFWSFTDALVPGLLLAQAFGRFGNYFNQELFGLPTNLPWGLEVTEPNSAIPVGLPPETLFHPTFLYESLWNVLGVVVLLVVGKKFALQWGKLTAVYFIWYGAGRIVWESIRVDPSDIFLGLRVNVWAAIAAVVLGIVIFAVQSRRHPGAEPSVYRPGREWAGPAAEVDSDETYSDSDELGNDATDAPETPVTSGPATSGAGKTS